MRGANPAEGGEAQAAEQTPAQRDAGCSATLRAAAGLQCRGD